MSASKESNVASSSVWAEVCVALAEPMCRRIVEELNEETAALNKLLREKGVLRVRLTKIAL